MLIGCVPALLLPNKALTASTVKLIDIGCVPAVDTTRKDQLQCSALDVDVAVVLGVMLQELLLIHSRMLLEDAAQLFN